MTVTVEGDGIDNDCDGSIDEEIKDQRDNDGDGYIDEDLSEVWFTIHDAIPMTEFWHLNHPHLIYWFTV